MNETEYDFRNGKRGAVVPEAAGQTKVTISVDTDTLDWFRAQVHSTGGGDYRLLMNQALRAYMQDRGEPLEDVLRRVLREESHSAGCERRPAARTTDRAAERFLVCP